MVDHDVCLEHVTELLLDELVKTGEAMMPGVSCIKLKLSVASAKAFFKVLDLRTLRTQGGILCSVTLGVLTSSRSDNCKRVVTDFGSQCQFSKESPVRVVDTGKHYVSVALFMP